MINRFQTMQSNFNSRLYIQGAAEAAAEAAGVAGLVGVREWQEEGVAASEEAAVAEEAVAAAEVATEAATEWVSEAEREAEGEAGAPLTRCATWYGGAG